MSLILFICEILEAHVIIINIERYPANNILINQDKD